MNYQVILLGFWLLLSSFAVDHGIYISVFDITHDASSGQGEIVIKSFSDDLTNSLRAMNLNIPADADPCDQQEALDDYLIIHFKMEINDQRVDWKFSKCNIENDTHWITLTYQSDLELSKVDITTDWMTEIFGNQQNIIKVKSGSQKLNARLGGSVDSTTFSFK